jgi:hypothetical protein
MAVPTQGDGNIDAAHRALIADPSLQFSLSGAPQPGPPPTWLVQLLTAIDRFIAASAPALGLIFKACLVLAALLIAWIVVRETLTRVRTARARAARPSAPETRVFHPTVERARALLEDADRLALEGRYGEAVRALLHRSIDDIERSTGAAIGPAATSREIALLDILSPTGRRVFYMLADSVERAFFAERQIGKQDFDACRSAYAGFALDGAHA